MTEVALKHKIRRSLLSPGNHISKYENLGDGLDVKDLPHKHEDLSSFFIIIIPSFYYLKKYQSQLPTPSPFPRPLPLSPQTLPPTPPTLREYHVPRKPL